MRESQMTFHGDDEDLAELFSEWFGQQDLVIAQCLGPLNADVVTGRTPEFAMSQLAKPGDMSSPAWVIAPADRTLVYDTITMRDGSGSKQRIALANRFVAGILFGGRTGPAELQPSVLGCSVDDDESRRLYERLAKPLKKRARNFGLCWLLPGAYEKLRDGWRLPRGQFNAPVTDLPNPG